MTTKISKETTADKVAKEVITISAPDFKQAEIRIIGTAPYMQCAFSQKAKEKIRATQAAGSVGKKGKAREARDFDSDFLGAHHISSEGWVGIPASAFRNASIDVCRMVGFKMTHAKMSIFFEADGLDRVSGEPLIKIEGQPERTEEPVRNATGAVDLRVRPMWRQWAANLRVKYDAAQFTVSDVANLVARAGVQVGIGEGRPFSKMSNGRGYGTFRLA